LGKIIQNENLRKRCFIILEDPNSEKDTVIRESILVLNDSIKRKLNVKRDDEFDWKELSKKVIFFKTEKDNDEFCNLIGSIRKLIGFESRHEIKINVYEDEAIKILAFVDFLINIIEKSNLKK